MPRLKKSKSSKRMYAHTVNLTEYEESVVDIALSDSKMKFWELMWYCFKKTYSSNYSGEDLTKFYLSRLTKEIDRCKEDVKRLQEAIKEMEAEKKKLLGLTEDDENGEDNEDILAVTSDDSKD